MTNEKAYKFWCPRCKIEFSATDEQGRATCPNCNGKRDDGLNQVSETHFQCVKCNLVFPGVFAEELKCPNGCNETEMEEP